MAQVQGQPGAKAKQALDGEKLKQQQKSQSSALVSLALQAGAIPQQDPSASQAGKASQAAAQAAAVAANAGTAAAPQPEAQDADSANPAKKAGDGTEAAAAQAQAQAQAMLQAQSKQAALKPVLNGDAAAQAMASKESELAAVAARNPKASASSLTASAEISPATLRPAASLNTATAIAGLKPWSRDWVFEGEPEEGPSSDVEGLLKLKEALDHLKSKVAQESASQGSAQDAASRAKGSVSAEALSAQAGKASAAGDPIASALAGMRGVIEDSRHDPRSNPQAASLGNGLSGADFVSTLNRARAGHVSSAKSKLAGEDGIPAVDGQRVSDTLWSRGASRQPATAEASLMADQLGGRVVGIDGQRRQKQSDGIGDQPFKPFPEATVVKQLQPQTAVRVPPTLAQAGYVVQGSMAKERLASASLQNISADIRNISQQGSGEMRIRLKPDNLGEIHMRVAAHGDQVALQIQASDDRAKHILEESMSQLKENLATHHLHLSQVELTVGQASASSHQGSGFGERHEQPGTNYFGSEAWRQDQRQSGGQASQHRDPWGSSQGYEERTGRQAVSAGGRASSASARAAMVGQSEGRRSAPGRLDVRA